MKKQTRYLLRSHYTSCSSLHLNPLPSTFGSSHSQAKTISTPINMQLAQIDTYTQQSAIGVATPLQQKI